MIQKASGHLNVSIVIPVFNAEATIGVLTERLVEVFSDRCALQIVLVNDGSWDRTHEVCLALVDKLPHIVSYICLAKNFGEHNAVMAGLRHSMGDYVVIMDDDCQNHPEDAVRLVDEARTRGLDLVYSDYPSREHHWFRILGSRFNGMAANFMLDKPKDLYLSSFKCLSRWLVREIVKYKGPFPYIDGLALRCTRNIGRIQVAHHRRTIGRSGYNVRKLVELWLNMCVNFSVMPLRVSAVLGLILMVCGALLGVGVVLEKLMGRDIPAGWPFLAIITLMFSGAQLLMLGIIGEYLGRLFLSINETPQFVIKEFRGVRGDCGDNTADRVEP
jgi:glycosyltransferase involved in cell wall biosynthesis